MTRIEQLTDAELVHALEEHRDGFRERDRVLFAELVARAEEGSALSPVLRDLAEGLMERQRALGKA